MWLFYFFIENIKTISYNRTERRKMRKRTVHNWDELPIVLDLKTVALIFDVTEVTVKRWLKNGDIKGTKICKKWFFDKYYIKSLIDNL